MNLFNACLAHRMLGFLLASIIALPTFVIALSWLSPEVVLWQHFQDTLLTELLSNTAILLLGVSIGVGVLGTSLAWLVVMVEFPGRKYLEWALLLPFAIPAYVLGFVYLGLFDYSGPIQSFLRENLGLPSFDIRDNYFSLIMTFVLVFYPYVYMMCRASFKRQQANMFASARLLGANMWQVFWSMSVPLARPAIAAGILVTMMETLADFGVVSLFNYDTFTTAIYSAWSDFRSVIVAAQLASILVIIAFVLIYLEGVGRAHIKYHNAQVVAHRPYQLVGAKAYIATGFVSFIVLLAFVVPMVQLLLWANEAFSVSLWVQRHQSLLVNTILLSLFATLIIISVAILLALPNSCGAFHSQSHSLSTKLATLGYAIPGSVLAVGLLYGVHYLSNFSMAWFGVSLSGYLFGSIALLLFAYTSRFMAVAYNAIEASTKQIKPSLIDSARLLGVSRLGMMFRIQLPLIMPGIIAACLLVSIDVIKELPATYLLRPFGWDTLAIEVYELSNEGLYAQAAIPALIMVGLALVLILVFQRFDKRLAR